MPLSSSLSLTFEELPKRMAKRIAGVLNGRVASPLIFSLKTFVAALLALYLAFWLGLDQPKWALMTVFIVSQPDSGLVLAKGFFRLLGTIAVEALTLNNRLDEISPTESVAQQRAGLQRLAEMVSSFRAAFGVRFDPVGERIQLVDEKGELVNEDRALLAVLDPS